MKDLSLDTQGNIGIDTVEHNRQLSANTGKSLRDFYRGGGISPAGKSMLEISDYLKLPTIYKSEGLNYDDHFNTHKRALYLNDGTLLDIVSDNWVLLQPIETIALFMDFCNDHGLEVERIGTFISEKDRTVEGGALDRLLRYRVYISAKLESSFEVGVGDIVDSKIIFTFGYLNGTGFKINLLINRLVCENGLKVPVKVGSKIVNHIGTELQKRQQIKQLLFDAQDIWASEKEDLTLLNKVEMTHLEAMMFLVNHFSVIPFHRELAQKALEDFQQGKSIDALGKIYDSNQWFEEKEIVRECVNMFRHNLFTGSELCSGNVWGLLNSVTEYCNWKGRQLKNPVAAILEGTRGTTMYAVKQRLLSDFVKVKQSVGV